MAQAVPKTIYSDLRSQASRLLAQASASPFELRRLATDAEKLASVDGMGALEIKATIAAISGDYEGSWALFDRLLLLTSAEPRYLQRAIHVSALTGQSFRLKSLYDKFLKESDAPGTWKRDISQLLGFNGWLRESVKLQLELMASGEETGTADLKGLDFPKNDCDEDFDAIRLPVFQTARTSTDVLDLNEVDDEVVALLFSKSITLLRERSLPPTAVRTIHVVHDDSTSGLLVSFVVKAPTSRAADAEWELFGILAEDVPKPMLDGVIALGVLGIQGDSDGN